MPPGSSAGKESTCNAGDPGSIPRMGRSPGEGTGYQLQYSQASLVAQLVKNLPALWETWDWFLDLKDPLQKGMATHSSILAWKFPWAIYSPWGCKELDVTEWLSLTFTSKIPNKLRNILPYWLLNCLWLTQLFLPELCRSTQYQMKWILYYAKLFIISKKH